jgi:L-fuconolactonase
MMPFGGHDWLALTTEPTLEPELPICDPYHDFWECRTERIPYQRCLFDSNFPVAKVSSSDNVLYNAFKRVSKGYSAAECAAMFHDTAARV